VSRDEIIQQGIEAGRRHRRERGLPEQITDSAVLSQLAALLRPTPVARTTNKPAAKKR